MTPQLCDLSLPRSIGEVKQKSCMLVTWMAELGKPTTDSGETMSPCAGGNPLQHLPQRKRFQRSVQHTDHCIEQSLAHLTIHRQHHCRHIGMMRAPLPPCIQPGVSAVQVKIEDVQIRPPWRGPPAAAAAFPWWVTVARQPARPARRDGPRRHGRATNAGRADGRAGRP